jgi:hypothetical protein
MKVKFSILMSLVTVAQVASAESWPLSHKCWPEDVQTLRNLVTTAEIRSGAELKNSILDLLTQTQPPMCAVKPGYQEWTRYRLDVGSSVFIVRDAHYNRKGGPYYHWLELEKF